MFLFLDVWFCCWGLWFGVRKFRLFLCVCVVFVLFGLGCIVVLDSLRCVALRWVGLCCVSRRGFSVGGLWLRSLLFLFLFVCFFLVFHICDCSFCFGLFYVLDFVAMRRVALGCVVLRLCFVCFWFGVRGCWFSFFFSVLFWIVVLFSVGFVLLAWGLWFVCFFCFCCVFVFAFFLFE